MDRAVEKNIIKILKANKGYARTEALKIAGIHSRQISAALTEGILVQIRRGLYKLAAYPWSQHASFADVAAVQPQSVICLISALSYYELTTANPSEIYIALPARSRAAAIDYPPTRVFYFSGKMYSEGVIRKQTASGVFNIYSKEKTVCDIFRFRNRLGEDTAIEGLRNYLRSKDRDVNELLRVAAVCRIQAVMMPYIKGMLG